jgi:hypothetical protein
MRASSDRASGEPLAGRERRLRRAIPPALGLVTALGVALATARSSTPWTLTMDTGSVFLGQTLPAFRTWLEGRVPEWSDLLWGGYPLIGDSTTAALYPPHLLAYLATLGAPLRFFDVAFAVHLGLFAAGSAWLVRSLGASAAATLLAGVLGALCPFAHYCGILFFPVLGAQAWWPWTFAAAERLAHPATPLLGRTMVLGWVALAAQVLVGVPEQATYSAIVATCWLLARRTPLPIGARLVRLTLLGAGSAALAAPQLLPTLLLIPSTPRAGAIEGGSASLMLNPPLRLIVPGFGAPHSIPAFLGAATLCLAVVAALRRRPRAAFMLAVGAVAFVTALGSAGGLHAWLRRFPPFEYFRSPLKLFALAEFTVAWAAALGADALWRLPHRRWRIAAVVLAAAALAERVVYVAGEPAYFRRVHANDGLAPQALSAIAGTAPSRERRADAPPPVVFDLGGPVGGGCVRSLNTLVGVASLHAGSVALLGRRQLAVLRFRPQTAALPKLLGAHYLLVPSASCDAVAARFGWPVVETTTDFCVVRNPDPAPHHELVTHVTPVPSDDAMLAALKARPDGPVPVVAPPEALAALGGGTLSLEDYRAGRAVLRANTTGPALLLVRDALVPGWRVDVNGAPVTPHAAAGLYFAVPLSGGSQDVRLTYRAPGFRAGLAVLVVWTAAIGVAAAVRRRRSLA